MRKVKVLMVEDEANVLAINKEFLEGQGYETLSALTIAEARGELEDAPDLILLDVMLPDGMGWDFAGEIRAKTNAPIIYLTCRDENESVVKGLMRGGDDYVVKPYDLHVLHARILSVLRRAGFALAGIYDLPPLRVDILSGTATINNERVDLTPREMQLLVCLVISAGRFVKSEDIYRRVWGEPVGNYTHTVEVNASTLRKKLKLTENSLFEIRTTPEKEVILLKTRY